MSIEENTNSFNKKLFLDHFIITLIIMSVCWGLCIVLGIKGITKLEHVWVNIPWAFGALSTTIASYVALKKNKEISSFKDWIKNIFDFKHSILSYLIVIGFAVLHAVVMCLINGYKIAAPFYMMIIMLPIMYIGGGLEEAGWRYITFYELDKKWGFNVATIMTSLIWAIWHLPLFYIKGTDQYERNFVIFSIMVIGLSYTLSAIRKVTGSVWLCAVFHMFVNAIPQVFRYDFYGSYKASIITSAIMIIVSLLFVHFCKNNERIK